jgi:hypothetical protein
MDNKAFLSIKSHSDDDTTNDEVMSKEVDENIMDEANRRSKREERAKALYVLLNLSDSHS